MRLRAFSHIAVYGAALALVALVASWLETSPFGIRGPWSGVMLAVAILFAALGGWLGFRLAPRPRSGPFVANDAAAGSLGLSPREREVLAALASGAPNKVIARRMGISPNTVKSDLARLFEKLGANTRTEAIARARALDLVP